MPMPIPGEPTRELEPLGSYATVEDALKEWPWERSGHRRSGYPEAAEELRAKLDRLKERRADGVA